MCECWTSPCSTPHPTSQTVSICSGELNNAAAKKYDIEGWFPGFGEFKELVSASNCTDYQSRAMEIRYGFPKANEKTKEYVHMLNATLCATGRVICCILENYQAEDGSGVRVPEVLRPYVGAAFMPYTQPLQANKVFEKAQKAKLKAAAQKRKAAGEKDAAPKKPKKEAKPAAAAATSASEGAAAVAADTAAAKEAAAKSATMLDELDAKLLLSTCVSGHRPTAEDAKCYDAVAAIVAATGAEMAASLRLRNNVRRWYSYIGSFAPEERAAW